MLVRGKAERMLVLLSLLQHPGGRTGTELAERLEVSPRTIRSDVAQLREIGYHIVAVPGGPDGYRLGPSGRVVPLLLEPEEATAVAVGLRTGVNCVIGGMEEESLRALAKLERVLSPRVRHRISTLNRYTVPLPAQQPVPVVNPDVLTFLVNLCDNHERLRFWYDDEPVEVEPYRLANRGHRWYLLGYDVRAERWSGYEVPRIGPRTPTGPRFRPRQLPDEKVTRTVFGEVAATWRCQSTMIVHAPADIVAERLTASEGEVSPVDESSCRLFAGAESWPALALILGRIGFDFVVDDGAQGLLNELDRLGRRYTRAVTDVSARARGGASSPALLGSDE